MTSWIYTFSILLFAFSSKTLAAGEGKAALNALGGVRQSFTYGETTIESFNNSAISSTSYFKTYGTEVDVFMPLSLHFGIRETLTQDAQISFNGGSVTRGEMYFSLWEAGLRVIAPIPILQPWAGIGYMGGMASVNNPLTRGNDDTGVIVENETHNVWGYYVHGGVDILVAPNFGLRAAFQRDTIESDKYFNLGMQALKMVQKRYYGGLFIAY